LNASRQADRTGNEASRTMGGASRSAAAEDNEFEHLKNGPNKDCYCMTRSERINKPQIQLFDLKSKILQFI
jgi:hypothetical protein